MKKSGKTGQALLLVMLLFVFASLLASCSGGKQTTAAEGAQEDGQPKLEPGRLGVVFQDPSLYPWRTVFENVELGLEIRGVKKADRKNTVQKYLTMVGLDGFEHKYPHQLSGGMKQRAGLARALANRPDVLLMDEPFGAVDHLTRLQLQNDLLNIWEAEKKTVVFVTHDVNEAVFLGDRVVLLSPRPGKLKQIFNISHQRPRERGDAGLLKIQNDIYAAIYENKKQAEPEYHL